MDTVEEEHIVIMLARVSSLPFEGGGTALAVAEGVNGQGSAVRLLSIQNVVELWHLDCGDTLYRC